MEIVRKFLSWKLRIVRAHRAGKPIDRERNPVTKRQIIVKFSSFQVRTLVYRSCVKDEGKPSFYIDQTHRRFKLRKKAGE